MNQVDAILAEKAGTKQPFFLVKWLGYGPEHNSWEPADCIPAELIEARRCCCARCCGGGDASSTWHTASSTWQAFRKAREAGVAPAGEPASSATPTAPAGPAGSAEGSGRGSGRTGPALV